MPIIKFRIKLDEKQRKRNKYKLTVRTEMWEFEDKRENSRYPFHLSCNSTSQNEKKKVKIINAVTQLCMFGLKVCFSKNTLGFKSSLHKFL